MLIFLPIRLDREFWKLNISSYDYMRLSNFVARFVKILVLIMIDLICWKRCRTLCTAVDALPSRKLDF